MMPGPPPADPNQPERHRPAYDDDYGDNNPFRLRQQQRPPDEELSSGDWLLCVLCPGIGCIAGFIRLAQGRASAGKMIAFSLLFGFLWNIFFFLLRGGK
jgi:hypothetical protein